MKYQALAESLRPLADAVVAFLRAEEGANRFVAEQPLTAGANYSPTLHGHCRDRSIVAVEVNEGTYTGLLDSFVLDSQGLGLPVRLFLAVPEQGTAQSLLDLHRNARRRGIGVLEVNGGTVRRHLPALRLSLTGLRAINRKAFPRRILPHLVAAEETFRNGDPAKGCSKVFDVLERCSRRVCLDIASKKLWRPGRKTPNHPDSWYEKTGAWAKVLNVASESGNWTAIRASGISIRSALWSQIQGLTDHRNDTGHEPASMDALRNRDTRLRTQFEHAVDTLSALLDAYPQAAKGMP